MISNVSSELSRVCLCNERGQPDCLKLGPTPHSIYPGQSLSVSVVAVGQGFGTVAGSVYAQFIQKEDTAGSPQLGTGQVIQNVIKEKCRYLYYTISSPGDMSQVLLVLTTNNITMSQYKQYTLNSRRTNDLLKFYHLERNKLDVLPILYGNKRGDNTSAGNE